MDELILGDLIFIVLDPKMNLSLSFWDRLKDMLKIYSFELYMQYKHNSKLILVDKKHFEIKVENNNKYFVCEYENQLVGFIVFRNDRNQVEICDVFVLEKYRRKGVFAAMYSFFQDCVCCEVDQLYLSTRVNSVSEKIYKKLGFETYCKSMAKDIRTCKRYRKIKMLDGLIIKKNWLNQIFEERKIIEIRSSNCFSHLNKRIALIESKSGLVKGTAFLYNSKELSPEEFKRLKKLHRVETSFYKRNYGWWLCDINKFENPIKYFHPPGAVIWVKDVIENNG